jgi:hypothetical protein
MALDHYISQVYLKNFNSDKLGNRLYAVRKSDLKTFTPRTRDVCRIENGSTNRFLKEDRKIEQFLKEIEPRYNRALASLRADTIDEECVFTIAGFVAFVVACTPTAMRLFVKPLQSVVRTEAELLERRGRLPPSPPTLGRKTLSELLDDGTVNVDVDKKFPQALGLGTLVRNTSIFGNSRWEIISNSNQNGLFLTSDFPAAVERLSINAPINRIVPLAPDVAIRIIPDVTLSRSEPDLAFPKFHYRRREPRTAEIRELNRLIVRSAENLVFYSKDLSWVCDFVAKNRDYRIETMVQRVPMGSGFMHLSSTSVVRAADLNKRV